MLHPDTGTPSFSCWGAGPLPSIQPRPEEPANAGEKSLFPTVFGSPTATAQTWLYLCHCSGFVLHCSFSPSACQEVLLFHLASPEVPASAPFAIQRGYWDQLPLRVHKGSPLIHPIPPAASAIVHVRGRRTKVLPQCPLQPRENHPTCPARLGSHQCPCRLRL